MFQTYKKQTELYKLHEIHFVIFLSHIHVDDEIKRKIKATICLEDVA